MSCPNLPLVIAACLGLLLCVLQTSSGFLLRPHGPVTLSARQQQQRQTYHQLLAGGFGKKPVKPKKELPRVIPESDKDCPCCSGKTYKDCCEPYLDKGIDPPSAEAMMRSRYCAYATRKVDHILKTTHPTNTEWRDDKVKWKKAALAFADEYRFLSLNVQEVEEVSDSLAYVKFTSRFSAFGKKSTKEMGEAGKDFPFTERSKFVKEEDGLWYYVEGDVKENYE